MVRSSSPEFTYTKSCSGKMLKCNVHECPYRCHQILNHSKMDCKIIISLTCPMKHKIVRKCHEPASVVCRKCEADARTKEKKRQRDYKLDQESQKHQQAYAAQLAEIDEEMQHHNRTLKDQKDEQDRAQAMAQKKQDLLNLKLKASRTPQEASPKSTSHGQTSATSNKTDSSPGEVRLPHNSAPTSNESAARNVDAATEHDERLSDCGASEATDDWEWQKKYEGAKNEALDGLIAMTGSLTLFSLL